LHAALDAIRKSRVAIVVEGNFDVLSLHEAGIENAVAPMGTALTAEQANVLKQLADTVVVVFDGDTAGQRAASKVIPIFVDADLLEGKIARMPAGVDPDDYVKANGADAFRRLVENSRPILDQFIQEAAENPSIEGRVATLERVAELLVKVNNQTKRELYAQQLAGVLRLSPQQVSRALRDATTTRARPTSQTAPAAPVAPAVLPAEELAVIVLLATYPQLLRTADAARAGELLVHPVLRQLHRAALEMATASGQLDVPAWEETAPPDVQARVARAMIEDPATKAEDPPGLLRKLATRLELSRVTAEIDMNARMQREARERGDEATLRALSVRGIELRKIKEGLLVALQRP
jgi:DNA primase